MLFGRFLRLECKKRPKFYGLDVAFGIAGVKFLVKISRSFSRGFSFGALSFAKPRRMFIANQNGILMPDSFTHRSATLGADLRSLRKARGVTLQDLSEATGRSLGWLSQVERDISSPSIDEIRALAGALNVPMSLFFGQAAAVPEEEGYVVRANGRRRIGAGENGLVEELLSPDLSDDFEVIHSTFEAGSEKQDFETRPTQELGYVISGSLRLWVGARQFDVEAGDSFRIRAEPYRWANVRDKDAVVIWVIAPPVY